MTQEIKKNADGTLTDEQQQEFMLRIAGVARASFSRLGAMSDEQVLKAFQDPANCPEYAQAVSDIFNIIVEADLPQSFNDYVLRFAADIVQKTFGETTAKNHDNLRIYIEQQSGLEYDDMTPKEIIGMIDQEALKKKIAEKRAELEAREAAETEPVPEPEVPAEEVDGPTEAPAEDKPAA